MMKKMKMMCLIMAAVMMVMSVPAYAGSAAVYLFYSPYMNDYFLTASESERSSLEWNYQNGTQTYQLIGTFGYAENSSTCSNVPVYRFWNMDTTDHFYTISESEKIQTEHNYNTGKDGYKYEGVAFYVPAYGCTPVYRFFDVVSFSHVYITDECEKNQMISDYQNGWGNWRYEGVAWYW